LDKEQHHQAAGEVGKIWNSQHVNRRVIVSSAKCDV